MSIGSRKGPDGLSLVPKSSIDSAPLGDRNRLINSRTSAVIVSPVITSSLLSHVESLSPSTPRTATPSSGTSSVNRHTPATTTVFSRNTVLSVAEDVGTSLPVENSSSYTISSELSGNINKVFKEPPLLADNTSSIASGTVQVIQDKVHGPSDNEESDLEDTLNDNNDNEQPDLDDIPNGNNDNEQPDLDDILNDSNNNEESDLENISNNSKDNEQPDLDDISNDNNDNEQPDLDDILNDQNNNDNSDGTHSNTEDDIVVSSPPINNIELSIIGYQSDQTGSMSESMELHSQPDWDLEDLYIDQNAETSPDVGLDNNQIEGSDACFNHIDQAQTHEFIVNILPDGDDPCLEHPSSIHPNGTQITDTLPVITVKRKFFLLKHRACTND